AGVDIGVECAVPLGTSGVLAVGRHDVRKLEQFALALDNVDGMLAETSGAGVTIGVSPGTEAACATLCDDRSFNLLEDCGKVASLSRKVDAQSAGITHQRAGEVC